MQVGMSDLRVHCKKKFLHRESNDIGTLVIVM